MSNLRERPSRQSTKIATHRLRKLIDDEFLADFDPERSTRERRKLTRKTTYANPSTLKNTLYDDKGRLRDNNLDLCDCFDEKCAGCFYPCPECSSEKCGPVCRVHRKFTYDVREYDGKDGVVRNKHAMKN